jgi:hypothetical protein
MCDARLCVRYHRLATWLPSSELVACGTSAGMLSRDVEPHARKRANRTSLASGSTCECEMGGAVRGGVNSP